MSPVREALRLLARPLYRDSFASSHAPLSKPRSTIRGPSFVSSSSRHLPSPDGAADGDDAGDAGRCCDAPDEGSTGRVALPRYRSGISASDDTQCATPFSSTYRTCACAGPALARAVRATTLRILESTRFGAIVTAPCDDCSKCEERGRRVLPRSRGGRQPSLPAPECVSHDRDHPATVRAARRSIS